MLLWVKYCPSYSKICTLWLLTTAAMYSCLNIWGILKTLANISQLSLTVSRIFKRHAETLEAAFSTTHLKPRVSNPNQVLLFSNIATCISCRLQQELWLLPIYEIRVSHPAQKLSLAHTSSAPSKILACLCQSWEDNIKQQLHLLQQQA